MGQSLKAGDVVFSVLSDDYAQIKLEHQKAHQRLELSQARQAQFEKTQASLKVLLDGLSKGPESSVEAADVAGMPLGLSKAELLEASSQHARALAEWKRAEKLESDTTALIRRLRGGGGSADGLRVGDAKGKLLEARADLGLAQKSYKRAQQLSGEGVVAKTELERAARDVEAAEARFRAALEQAEMDLEERILLAKEGLDTARGRLHGAMEQVILDADLKLVEVRQEVDRRGYGRGGSSGPVRWRCLGCRRKNPKACCCIPKERPGFWSFGRPWTA